MSDLTSFSALLICALSMLGCSREQHLQQSDSRASQLQDLSQLRHDVALDVAFDDGQRARALGLIGDAQARAGTFSSPEFELLVEHIIALADNGHSTVWSSERLGRFNRIPARLLLLADGVFVVRAKGQAVALLGQRIESIDGVPIGEILLRLRAYRGGRENLRDFDDVSLLESPELLHAAGVAKSAQEIHVTTSQDGNLGDIDVAALAPDPNDPAVAPLRLLAGSPYVNEDPAWQSAFRGSPVPLWIQDADRMFRLVPLPGLSAVYLQFKANSDTKNGERIGEFISKARQFIESHPSRNIILDMRFDSGGDYTKTASFMTRLPRMIPKDGLIFVITHAATFSAGITSVGFVKQASPRQTVVVGEPIGDRLIFYGEPRRFTLPNSRIEISYATGLHDYLHGCHWFGPCYWVNWIYPVAVPTLEPEIAAPLSFAAIVAGRDPAMEAIQARLGKPQRGS